MSASPYELVNQKFFDRSRKFDKKQRAEQVEKLFDEWLKPCPMFPENFIFEGNSRYNYIEVFRNSIYDSLNDKYPDCKGSKEFDTEWRELGKLLKLEPWQSSRSNAPYGETIFTPTQLEVMRHFLINSRFPLRPTKKEYYAEVNGWKLVQKDKPDQKEISEKDRQDPSIPCQNAVDTPASAPVLTFAPPPLLHTQPRSAIEITATGTNAVKPATVRL